MSMQDLPTPELPMMRILRSWESLSEREVPVGLVILHFFNISELEAGRQYYLHGGGGKGEKEFGLIPKNEE